MKLTPWLVLLSLGLASCSGSKSAQKVNEETPQIELSDADVFSDTPSDEQSVTESDTPAASEGSDEVVVEDVQETTPEASPDASQEVVMEDAPAASEPVVEAAPVASEMTSEPTQAPVVFNEPGSMKQYTVKKNETLMMVAFKIYGDYGRWKEIANQNRSSLNGSTNLRAGMTLNYLAPAEEFIWNPEGNPYLIRTGDTLGKISQEVYASMKKWKLIWDNNRPLIKDPNRIYSGFTIYYLESGRDVATEM